MNDWIAKHEFAKFGCTPCHGGDGAATTIAAAHQGGRGWEDPMLSNALAAQNGLTMNEMIQMRCNFCHRHDAATPGMDEINLAKLALQEEKVPGLPCRRRARRRHRTRADLRGRPESRIAELRARDRRAHDVQLERAASDQGERGFAEHADAGFQLQARGIESADAAAAELAAPYVSAGIHSRSRSGCGGDATVANVNRDSDSERDACRALSTSN